MIFLSHFCGPRLGIEYGSWQLLGNLKVPFVFEHSRRNALKASIRNDQITVRFLAVPEALDICKADMP